MSGSNRPASSLKDAVVREYLEEMREQRGWARRTLENAIESFGQLERFTEEVSLGKSVSQLEHPDLKAYADWMASKGNAKTTAQLTLNVLRYFNRWLEGMGLITSEELALRNMKVNLEHLRGTTVVSLLTPAEVFKIRITNRKASLKDVAIFELFLCTGTRRSELVQLRADHLKWGKVPYDIELKGLSPYVAGSITLDASKIAVKTDVSRTVYFSKFAGEILLKWMDTHNIPLDSNHPIFPFKEEEMDYIMRKVTGGYAVVHPENFVAPSTKELGVNYGHMDVDASEIESSELRQALEKLQKREAEKREKFGLRKTQPKEDSTSRRVRSFINPHGMRYINICYMYHRDFHGHRHDPVHIAGQSGHAFDQRGTRSVLFNYLTNYSLVQSDNEWRNLWLGKPNHWSYQRSA